MGEELEIFLCLKRKEGILKVIGIRGRGGGGSELFRSYNLHIGRELEISPCPKVKVFVDFAIRNGSSKFFPISQSTSRRRSQIFSTTRKEGRGYT